MISGCWIQSYQLEQHQMINDEILNQQKGHLISELAIILDLYRYVINITPPNKNNSMRQNKMGEKNIQRLSILGKS